MLQPICREQLQGMHAGGSSRGLVRPSSDRRPLAPTPRPLSHLLGRAAGCRPILPLCDVLCHRALNEGDERRGSHLTGGARSRCVTCMRHNSAQHNAAQRTAWYKQIWHFVAADNASICEKPNLVVRTTAQRKTCHAAATHLSSQRPASPQQQQQQQPAGCLPWRCQQPWLRPWPLLRLLWQRGWR